MKKKLNNTAIINELKGNSSFFQSKSSVADNEERKILNKAERTEIRSEKQKLDLPDKRLTRRYSFEFYDDQINHIKRMKYEAMLQGKTVSMSEIVRHALDRYLKTQNK